MLPSKPQASAQLAVPNSDDTRWHEVWRLVLSAEQKPAGERRDFLLAADADSFVIRQAIAILEGTAASFSANASLPSLTGEGFTPAGCL
jgi:hypothetical protein